MNVHFVFSRVPGVSFGCLRYVALIILALLRSASKTRDGTCFLFFGLVCCDIDEEACVHPAREFAVYSLVHMSSY